MKYKYLLLLLFIFFGCTTLNIATIENTERFSLQPSVLIPDYDIYDIRIDLIRQTNKKQVNDSTTKTEKVPYHSVGFYLGNGLFIDLNNNLSLLVPKLLDINNNENFIIKQNHPGFFINSTTIYERTDSLFITKNEGPVKTKAKKIIYKTDSVLFIKEGLFSKYKIIESDSSFTYQSGLINTIIYKNKTGYFYKTFLGKKEYKQMDNDIYIGNRYILRNQGDMIEIFGRGLLNKEYLKYRIIKSDNKIYVYDNNYRGLEIVKTENGINVIENTRSMDSYSIE